MDGDDQSPVSKVKQTSLKSELESASNQGLAWTARINPLPSTPVFEIMKRTTGKLYVKWKYIYTALQKLHIARVHFVRLYL
jgi:hypothetical protein